MIVPAGGNWSARLPSWFSGRCLLNGDGGPAVQMITMMMILMVVITMMMILMVVITMMRILMVVMIVVTMLVMTMTMMICAFKILKVSSS